MLDDNCVHDNMKHFELVGSNQTRRKRDASVRVDRLAVFGLQALVVRDYVLLLFVCIRIILFEVDSSDDGSGFGGEDG